MQTKDALDILVYVCAIAVAITVGRTNIKKQTIADLLALVQTHELTIESLKEDKARQDAVIRQQNNKIVYLEGVVYGNTQLVQGGSVAGGYRNSSGNSPAHPKTTKNKDP